MEQHPLSYRQRQRPSYSSNLQPASNLFEKRWIASTRIAGQRLPADVDEWWIFDDTMDRQRYVQQTLKGYRATPTACGRVRRDDRELALRFFDERIPFTAVDAAFVLAEARRTYRQARTPLAPIGSLRYFIPIIHEILSKPVDPAQVSYLWLTMQGRI